MSVLDRQAVAQLREEFDRAFERAPDADQAPSEPVLSIVSGATRLVVRISDVEWLGRTPPLARLPGPMRALAGVGEVRGRLMPVFSLHLLLGVADGDPADWMLVPRGARAVGLTFGRFEGQHPVAAGALIREAGDGPGAALTSGAVRLGGAVLPILDLDAVLRRIEALAQPTRTGA